MVIITLSQLIDEKISLLKELMNGKNKPEVNSTYQIHKDAIKSIDDYDLVKVESIINQKKTYSRTLKIYKGQIGCLQRLMLWSGYKLK